MSKDMEQALLRRFQQLISKHTGLQIREQEREAFGKTITARVRALQLASQSSTINFWKLEPRRARQVGLNGST
jgi:hypothetical protein